MNKALMLLALSLLSSQSFATQILNDLKCENYTTKENCESLITSLSDIQLNKAEVLMFDNQIRKITYLLHKNKDEIAKKKYQYLFELLKENLTIADFNKIKGQQNLIFEVIKNYAISSDYTMDFKYSLNG